MVTDVSYSSNPHAKNTITKVFDIAHSLAAITHLCLLVTSYELRVRQYPNSRHVKMKCDGSCGWIDIPYKPHHEILLDMQSNPQLLAIQGTEMVFGFLHSFNEPHVY